VSLNPTKIRLTT